MKGLEFVRALERAGHEVTVVTGFPNYPTGRVYDGYRVRLFQRESIDGVNVERVPLYPSHSRSSVGRALNFLSFFLSALIHGLIRGGRSDFVYVYHPPITVGLAAALSGWVRRKAFVIEIQDLWPDMLAASGMTGTGLMARIVGPICKFVYARANAVIVQSDGMRMRLIERGVPPGKLVTIRNPADPVALQRPVAKSRAELGLGGGFALVYGGNLGAAQGLDTAIQAAKKASGMGAKIEFRLMGNGIDAEPLKALAHHIGAENVTFRDAVAKVEIPAIFRSADALLIQLADLPLFEITIPSKTQFYLATGKPILAAVAGEAARILKESGAAIVVPPGDVDAMAHAMKALTEMQPAALAEMGRHGAEYYQREFSFEKMAALTLDVIKRAAGNTSNKRSLYETIDS